MDDLPHKCVSIFLFLGLSLGLTLEIPQKPENKAVLGFYGDSGAVIGASSLPIPPVLDRIAFCESSGRHEDGNGVIRGNENPQDIGKWQINLDAWGKKAKELGYNIFTKDGNLKMALWIYYNEGTWPWKYSKKCWNNDKRTL